MELVLDPLSLFFLFLAFVGAVLVTMGFEPVSVFLFSPESAEVVERPGRDIEGTIECPSCGSMQTEVSIYDAERDRPGLLRCNACGHEWPYESK